MNTCRFGILAIILMLPAFLGTTGTEAPQNNIIPSQISAFYEDYNFISSYSTETERERLIRSLGEAKIPKDLECQRLKHVLARMNKLRKMMLVDDSEMVLRRGLTGSFFGFHFRPVLFVIGDVQLFEEKALIEIRSYELEPDIVLRYIAEYDSATKDDDENSSLGERVKVANGAPPGLEIHRWCCLNGKWMKNASDLFFLDEKK